MCKATKTEFASIIQPSGKYCTSFGYRASFSLVKLHEGLDGVVPKTVNIRFFSNLTVTVKKFT